MTILFENAQILAGDGTSADGVCVAVTDDRISFVGKAADFKARADRRINCDGNLLIPAFYNAHCHAAMSLFRGYGEDLPLKRWLDEKILPAEEKLDSERAYVGSMLAIAEMIRNGVVSFSDSYFFEDSTARAVKRSGIKANLARSIVSFDEDIDVKRDYRFNEACELVQKCAEENDERLKADIALHAEYTNVEKMCRAASEYAAENKIRMQVHLSETKHEVERCRERRGMSPVEFLNNCGVFDVPTTAAHCVWLDEKDLEILKQKNVFAAHNPVSNLKLASGVMPYGKLRDAGVNICLGTDGAASNNRLSILHELQTMALIHKGAALDAQATDAHDLLAYASRNGALSQGRDDCGLIREGFKADLVLINMKNFHNIPCYDPAYSLAYSVTDSDVRMTMCDGRILYENGTYNTIDTEKLFSDAKRILAGYFK